MLAWGQEAVEIVEQAYQQGENAADALLHETLEVAAQSAGCPRKLLDKLPQGSLRRRIHDDITVMVIKL